MNLNYMIVLDWGAINFKGGYWEHIVGKFWRGLDILDLELPKALHWLELSKDADGNEILVGVYSYGKEKNDWGFVVNKNGSSENT